MADHESASFHISLSGGLAIKDAMRLMRKAKTMDIKDEFPSTPPTRTRSSGRKKKRSKSSARSNRR